MTDTHPTYNDNTPSPSDIEGGIHFKLKMEQKGILQAGFGTITKKGIFIIKLTENIQKLEKLQKWFPQGYQQAAENRYNKPINHPSQHLDHNEEYIGKEEEHKSKIKAHDNALRALVKAMEPDIRTKMVRRTHRGTMRRWRR